MEGVNLYVSLKSNCVLDLDFYMSDLGEDLTLLFNGNSSSFHCINTNFLGCIHPTHP